MSRYFTPSIFALCLFLFQSNAWALTCKPHDIKLCNGSDCECWTVSTAIAPNGQAVIELKGKPDQAPLVLKRLGVNPKAFRLK